MLTVRWQDRRYEVHRQGNRIDLIDRGTQLDVQPVGDGTYRIAGGEENVTAYVYGTGDKRWVFLRGEVFELEMSAEAHPARETTATHETLSAPMPATVVRILNKSGDEVRKGDIVIVLEAMKMELPVRAPRDGRVTGVRCKEGDLVQPDVPLMELD